MNVKVDGGQFIQPIDRLQPLEPGEDKHQDSYEMSPEEGVRLVQAYASIRNPALRQAIVNFIRELANATDQPA